jgi:hypothetical protein
MKNLRLQRTAAAGGILYFVALFTGFALDAKGDPDPSLATLGDVASFMAEHPGRIASRYLVTLAAVFFLWFAADLRARIRRQEGEDDTLSSVAWGAGLLTVSLMLVGIAVLLAADFARWRVRVLPISRSCGRWDWRLAYSARSRTPCSWRPQLSPVSAGGFCLGRSATRPE